METSNAISGPVPMAVFKGKRVRRIFHDNEWWFAVVDVVAAFTDSPDAGAYWRKLKQRLKLQGSEVGTFCHGLNLPATDGKQCETDCVNMEGLSRIIQSIPSPKAEPFKRWLAKGGYARIQEFENPERAIKRTHLRYKPKDDFEMIFTMLGELATTEIHREEDSRGESKLTAHAKAGGKIAADARKALEKRLKRPIVTGANYLCPKEG